MMAFLLQNLEFNSNLDLDTFCYDFLGGVYYIMFFRKFSSTNNNISPYFITGFSDGESNFHIGISKHNSCKTG
jgi:hypothetical protein